MIDLLNIASDGFWFGCWIRTQKVADFLGRFASREQPQASCSHTRHQAV